MAENKKSFIAYCDWQETFEELSDEEAGKLVKHLFNYVNDKNPEASDKLTKMCFIPIKQSLKRDLKKYENYIEKQKINGSKGGRPKKAKETEKTQAFLEKPKKADSVNVSDNEIIDKSITIKEKEFDAFRKEYKNYATELYKDNFFIEAVSRNHIKHSNNEVNKKTIHKYLKLFLTHLDETQEKHHNKKDFQYHFSNWLRKQTIEFATVKKEPLRHW